MIERKLQKITNFCNEIHALKRSNYPKSDNINYTFKAMLCIMKDNEINNLDTTEETYFYDNCIATNPLAHKYYSRPVINILD